jgi:hypothetical protein
MKILDLLSICIVLYLCLQNPSKGFFVVIYFFFTSILEDSRVMIA